MRKRTIYGLLVLSVVAAGRLLGDDGAAHKAKQDPLSEFGVTGGNENHRSSIFCCGGTLGSLVTKNGIGYILSNNHILARSGIASLGEDIIHPGLIDVGCNASLASEVGDLSEVVPLGSGATTSDRVDAAIAAIRSGVGTTGLIKDIGLINTTPVAADLNMPVMKSGRTTGHTLGSVQAMNVSANVQYQRGCGSGKKFTITYANQISVTPGGFSAGGDSGSLIVSNNPGSCTQPVGLLFAGSSTVTLANPINKVIARLGGIQFVGGTPTFSCTGQVSSSQTSTQGFGPSQSAIDHARTVKERHEPDVLAIPGILGIGVGAADDNAAEAVIVIYVQTGHAMPEAISDRLDGLRMKVITTEPFVAYGNKQWGDTSCSEE